MICTMNDSFSSDSFPVKKFSLHVYPGHLDYFLQRITFLHLSVPRPDTSFFKLHLMLTHKLLWMLQSHESRLDKAA